MIQIDASPHNWFGDANKFVIRYIDRLNELFEIYPGNSKSAFRPLGDDIGLNTILCIKEQRIASDGSGFSYGGKYYQLMTKGTRASVPYKAKIIVLGSHKQGLRVQYNGVIYETNLLPEKPRKKSIEKP